VVFKMQKQMALVKDSFEKNAVEAAKSLIESLNFKMICENGVSKKHNKRTLAGLREFRAGNWDKKLSRDEAYKKYMSSY